MNSREAALYFIDTQLKPGDEVAIVSYSKLKGLTLHCDLSSQNQKAREVVEKFGMKEVLGRVEIEGPYDWLIYKNEVLNFIKTIKDLAKALGNIQGKKHIVFLSSGIMYSVFLGSGRTGVIVSSEGLILPAPDFIDSITAKMYEEMIKELASSNSSIYALYADGVGSSIDLERGKLVPREELGMDSLQMLSEGTGGKYFGNIRNYEKIMEEIQSITGSYYILGYYINEEWDGKYHKIEVKVSRDGCDVLTLPGYFNPKPFSKLSKLEKQLRLENLALAENPQFPPDFVFPLKTLSCSMEKESTLVMISKIPVEAIQRISGEKAEVVNFIIDKEDNIIDSKKWEVSISRFPQKDVYYYSLSSLSPGVYKCRVVIRNLETGKTAIGTSSVIIPTPLDSGISLDSPLLLVPEKDSFYLKGTLLEKKGKGKESLGLLNLYPYDPSQFCPVIDDLPLGTTRLLAVIRCLVSKIQKPDIRLSARLVHHRSGKLLPLNFFILNKYLENEMEFFFLWLQIGKLEPGEYQLGFLLEEMNSKVESFASTTFTIK